MKTFLRFIAESATILYRGINPKQKSGSKTVIWTSTSKEHAKMYADGTENVEQFKVVKPLIPIDLNFRTAEIDVNYSDIRGRISDAILERFEQNKISEDLATKLLDELRNLKLPSSMKVFQWMYNPKIISVIKRAGFNSILQREGLTFHQGNVITYGILDSAVLKKIEQ